MFKKRITKPALLYAALSLAILLSGCVGSTQQSSQPEQRNYPTLFITPMVTQVIATRSAPTATPEEESTPTQVLSSSYDPLKVAIYYPIRECVASRLRVGDSAFVAYNGGQMGVYPTSDITFAPMLRYAQTGEAFLITDGPWCEENTIIWKVKTIDEEQIEMGVENYVPEGNGEMYWLLPLEENPGIATPKPTQQQGLQVSIPKFYRGCR